ESKEVLTVLLKLLECPLSQLLFIQLDDRFPRNSHHIGRIVRHDSNRGARRELKQFLCCVVYFLNFTERYCAIRCKRDTALIHHRHFAGHNSPLSSIVSVDILPRPKAASRPYTAGANCRRTACRAANCVYHSHASP